MYFLLKNIYNYTKQLCYKILNLKIISIRLVFLDFCLFIGSFFVLTYYVVTLEIFSSIFNDMVSKLVILVFY